MPSNAQKHAYLTQTRSFGVEYIANVLSVTAQITNPQQKTARLFRPAATSFLLLWSKLNFILDFVGLTVAYQQADKLQTELDSTAQAARRRHVSVGYNARGGLYMRACHIILEARIASRFFAF